MYNLMTQYGIELLAALEKAGLAQNLTPQGAANFATVLDNQYDAITLMDTTPRIIYANKKFEDVMGCRNEEFIGKDVAELIEEGKFEAGGPSLQVLSTKSTASFYQETRNGRQVLITANPLFDNEGNVALIICNVRDLTDLNRLKESSLSNRDQRDRYELEALELRARNRYQAEIVSRSKAMASIGELAVRAAGVNATILITGENGVGKGVLASFIHRHSSRNDQPFIQLNCSSIPENLFESEMFGYEDGAFSGARRRGKPGLLEVANNGTLFLDEIGDIPLSVQPKLLHFLQEGYLIRLGSTTQLVVDARIIAATNADLDELISAKQFREDLFYRLNVIPINIPPLRDRLEDIVPLANKFLKTFNTQYNRQKALTIEAQTALTSHSWPGNVRELQNLIERVVLLIESDQITDEHIARCLDIKGKEVTSKVSVSSLMPMQEAYREVEYQLLRIASSQFTSSRSIARALGISHPTVSKKLKEHNLQ